MNEVWKDIAGYEGLYQVSNRGRVKSVGRMYYCGNHNSQRFQPEAIMRPTEVKGYKRIALSTGKIRKSHLIHRLVAESFLQIPDDLRPLIGTRRLQINHKDEDTRNNDVVNLEWCDSSYNVNYGSRNRKAAEKNTNGKKARPVLCVETNEVFPSQQEVHRRLGFNQADISSCCKRGGTSHGYHWRFADQI